MSFINHWYVLLGMLLFWGGLSALVIWAVGRVWPSEDQATGALRILNERFARGEIDQQEFEQRKAALLRS